MTSSTFFGIATLAYVFSMIGYITYLLTKSDGVGRAATAVTVIGFVSQTMGLFLRWKEFSELFGLSIWRSVPLTNLYESLVFFIWCLVLGYLIVEFKYKNRSFGAFVAPVAVLTLSFIALYGISSDIQPLVPALKSNWLLVHVMLSFLAYATFAISFCSALMYLILTTEKKNEGAYIFWTVSFSVFTFVMIAMAFDYLQFGGALKQTDNMGNVVKQNILFKASFLSESGGVRIASYLLGLAYTFMIWNFGGAFRKLVKSFNFKAEILDDITYKSIAIGFPIFSLGGLVFGAIWANTAWGTYWSWDPKETWSFITWLVYAFYLHAKFLRGWRGHKIASVAVIGFVAVIFTYLGVNLLLSGLHAYGGQ